MNIKIKKRTFFECPKCKTLYQTECKAIRCGCDKFCSNDLKGRHAWHYQNSFMGMAFYKCRKCGKELIGKTTFKKDPLDEIFISKVKDLETNQKGGELK